MRFVIAFAISLMSFAATAQTRVDIVTRLGPTAAQYHFLSEFVEVLNKQQSEYDYKISVVPGAEGETAFKRFMSMNQEENRQAILYSAQVTIADPRYNRIPDFHYLTSLSISVTALMVNKDGPKSIEELVEKIKSKEVSFFAAGMSSNAARMLNQLFLKKYGIEHKVKEIRYPDAPQILRSVLNKESDYTIYNPESMYTNLNVLILSNSQRAKAYPDVMVGKEVGFPEFAYNAFSMFSVPKSNTKLYESVKDSFAKACASPSVQNVIEVRKYAGVCMNNDEIMRELIKERDLLIRLELKEK